MRICCSVVHLSFRLIPQVRWREPSIGLVFCCLIIMFNFLTTEKEFVFRFRGFRDYQSIKNVVFAVHAVESQLR